MHDSGGARFAVLGILMTSAVAMFFSWSGATDLSDRFWVQFLLQAPFSETPCCETSAGFSFGRTTPAKVMTLLPSSVPYCRSLRCFPVAGYAKLYNFLL